MRIETIATLRSTGSALACRRRSAIGLTGSRCRRLRRALRLGLRRLSLCLRLLKLRLLRCAVRAERVVIDRNERKIFEIRLMIHRY